MSEYEELKKYLEKNKKEIKKEIKEIVQIDSPTYPALGTNKVIDYFSKKFKLFEIQSKRLKGTKGTGDHLLVTIKGKQKNKSKILLIGHCDTVFPLQTSDKRPFKIKGKTAFGPGVADMKSSLITCIHVIKFIQEKYLEKVGEIQILFNSDEERGNPSSRTIIEKLAKNTSAGLIIEPARANGSIVSARKGSVIGKLEVNGIAAHSGVEPEKGASAIYEITKKIAEILKLKVKNGNINVTGLMGGDRPNIVAEKAECLIELRASEQSTLNKTTERIKKIVAKKPFVPKTKSTYKIIGQRPAMEFNQKTNVLLKITEKIYEKARMRFSHTSTGGGSDGNYLSAMGVPVLDGLGPIGGSLHTDLEYLQLESIPRRGAVLGTLIIQLSSCSEIK
tara:strand:- start:9932 stop:11104 length:1173 start_codon:yes stop_codon:yes gene_type:complete